MYSSKRSLGTLWTWTKTHKYRIYYLHFSNYYNPNIYRNWSTENVTICSHRTAIESKLQCWFCAFVKKSSFFWNSIRDYLKLYLFKIYLFKLTLIIKNYMSLTMRCFSDKVTSNTYGNDLVILELKIHKSGIEDEPELLHCGCI